MQLIIKAICETCNFHHDLTGVEGVDIEGYIRDEVIIKCPVCDEDKCDYCNDNHKDCDGE